MTLRLIILYVYLYATSPFTILANEVESVPKLNIPSYMGTWHQIAAIPAWFQKKCKSDITANYQRLETGEIKVTNRCRKKNGSYSKAVGQARINQEYNSTVKLEVTFAQLLNKWLWFIAGDYWVLDLGKDYSYSVVGDPKRKYLWILARTPNIDRESLVSIEKNIRLQGYDTCRVKITQTRNLHNTRLCDLKSTSQTVAKI